MSWEFLKYFNDLHASFISLYFTKSLFLQIKLPMRPDNAVTANPQLSDPLLVATLCAATPSSALAESWTVASPSALAAMEPVCTPHV
jgi:hypothetical protein